MNKTKPRNVIIDNVAIRRRIEGFHRTDLNAREREKAVRILHEKGLRDFEMVAALGYTGETICRIRKRLGLPVNRPKPRNLVNA